MRDKNEVLLLLLLLSVTHKDMLFAWLHFLYTTVKYIAWFICRHFTSVCILVAVTGEVVALDTLANTC